MVSLARGKPYLPLLLGFLLALAALEGSVPAVHAQTSVRVESNPQLFAVMCALDAAGYEANVSVAAFHPVRARLHRELLRMQGPAVEAVRKFYQEHRLADSAATLSRYVSFALVVGPPPKFDFVLSRDQLPPDVLAIEGFGELLVDFYREGQIGKLWQSLQPDYDREISRLQGPVAQIVVVSPGYLREIINPAGRRSFAIYVEPMVGAKTNFRSYGDQYALVLSPGPELPLDDIRHAFLHFLLDPLPLRYPAAVESKKALLHFAARAPRLPNEFKEDFSAFVAECLVRAVEFRLRKLPAAKLAAALDEAERDGYVLVRAFSRELERFEQAEPAMIFFFPELLKGIDPVVEARRLEKLEFAPEPQLAAQVPEASVASNSGETSEVDRELAEGERQIAAQNGVQAAAAFERVLERAPNHPRALYGLAMAAILLREGERAKQLFQRLIQGSWQPAAIESGRAEKTTGASPAKPDPLILAWSHVYLGRIHDVEGNRELALSEYRAALAVEGAPESARIAARRGIEKGYEPAALSQDAARPRP